jgi:SAM-dependent methyltransferase
VPEFTGERLIPGKVNVDLLNEHLARYMFAVRLAGGKRVLDAGCGAGYGAAELARVAASVVGADIASDAVVFAREQYRNPNLNFEQASCTALPHPDGSFDLVVAFELIEHLADWRSFLQEVRRLLAPGGQFVVSTPNRLYYTESRGAQGANPFHVHEFDFAEFRAELGAVFPDVALFLENHVEGMAFQPNQIGHTAEVRVDAGAVAPDDAHFFVAVCAHRPQLGNPTFVYIPSAANVLRERERHIALLQQEVDAKDRLIGEREARVLELQQEVERSNQWALGLNQETEKRAARIVDLQEEVRALREAYEQRLRELETELEKVGRWAKETEARASAAEAQLGLYRASRWMRLGRTLGLGPESSGR